jgi:hypothetical protein
VSILSTPTHVGRRDHLLGAFMALSYLVILLVTSSDLAMSRDEGFYVVAAERYGTWYDRFFDDPSAAVQRDIVDRYWAYNNEHPALPKTMFAWTWLLDQKGYPKLRELLGLTPEPLFPRASMAYRFFGMLSASLTLWLIYIFGARGADRRVGMFAALSFATLPRIFYHAHLDCFDVPIVLMISWTIYAYWRSLVNRRWSIMTGIAFGCALATKHNSWIVPGMLFVHWAWVASEEFLRRRAGERPRLIIAPYWLLSMAILGPLIFFVSWPWIWFDTWARIGAYASFHLHHVYYNMAYFDVNWFRPPFPTSYAFVMTLFTLPLTITALSLTGILVRARALLPSGLATRFMPRGSLRADVRATDVLWLGSALAPYAVFLLPSTPIFGGTKHWFTAYPFLCLFAGYAALYVVVSIETRLISRGLIDTTPVAIVSMTILLAPSFAETAHSHRFGLSHYTLPAGGVPGAADLGMNRQFWGFTTGSVVEFLRTQLPKGGSVFLHDTTGTAFDMLKRDGRLPPNIRAAAQLSDADLVLVQHEHHMAEVDFQAWQAFGSVQPVHVLTYDGVPIVSIYEHPRHRPKMP